MVTCLFAYYLIIIIMQTYLKVLNFYNSVECVSKIKSVFSSYLSCNIWGCVYSAYPFILWWLCEYMYFILSSSSSNRKYDPVAIVSAANPNYP